MSPSRRRLPRHATLLPATRAGRRSVAIALTVLLLVLAAPVAWVQIVGQSRVRQPDTVSAADAILVLGAGLRPDGTPSAYLRRRLDAAAELYTLGVSPRVILSGDAHRAADGSQYDEPASMQAWIVQAGVPESALVLDREGFDTTASCRRAREVFGATTAVVVTQDYHLRRALFSCARAGLDAVGTGVSAKSVRPVKAAWWHVRELPASWKAALREVPGAVSGLAGRFS